jgi:hypothetical protein
MSLRTNIYVKNEDEWLRFRIACMRLKTTASRELQRLLSARLVELEAAEQSAQKKPAAGKKPTRAAKRAQTL